MEKCLFQRLCVWCRPRSGQWELGIIQSMSGDEALVSLSDGNVRLLDLL